MHTNPEAHPPLAEPPLLEHSLKIFQNIRDYFFSFLVNSLQPTCEKNTYDSEKQVPFLLVDCPVDKVDDEIQGSFLNCNQRDNKGQSTASISLVLMISKPT